MNNDAKSETVKAADFLIRLPGPFIDLTAIHPTTGKITGRSFSRGNGDDRNKCAAWIKEATARGYGVYFNVNGLRQRLGIDERDGKKIMKANESDAITLNAFHVDADVSKDITDPAVFKAAKAELLRAVQGMNKPPSIIIDSGNGFGLFWMLRKPVKVTAANLEQLKAKNIALRDAVRALPGGSADACQNLDRVMRLPFTINYPNATKIKRGRVEVVTDLIADDRDFDVLYNVEDFQSAPVESPPTSPADNEAMNVPDTVDLSRLAPDFLDLIRNGPKAGSRKIGDGSNSATLFSIARRLVEAGFDDGEIVAVLSNPDNKGSAAHIWRDGRTREPEAQAIKTVLDLRGKYNVKTKLARTTAAEDFGDDPLDPLDPLQEKEQEDIRQQNLRTKPLRLGKRPMVKMFAGEFVEAMDKVQRIVGPQTDRPDPIFKRNGRLVHLSRNLTDEGIKLKHFEKDALVILDATKHWMATRLEKSIEFVVPDGKDDDGKMLWKPINCPLMMVDRILGDSTNWLGYPALQSTIETPTLRKDGTVLDKLGYDVDTGLFFDPADVKFPSIKDSPTVEQGKTSLKMIDDLLVDFPFADNVSKSVAMSLLLTSVVRRTMDIAPIYFIDADDAEAGKTTLAKVGGALATGRDIEVQAYAANVEERDKLLPALLLCGSPYLLFDNLPDGCVVEGAEMEKIITSPTYQSRPFGKNDTVRTMPTNATMVFTGNKMGAKGAMTTRGLLIRIVPDKPLAERKFTHDDIVAHTIKLRPLLVAAILTALRAFIVHGKEVERDRDRFPDWSKLIRSALIWYGYADPQRGGDKLRVDDPVKEAQREVIRAWWRKFADKPMLARDLARDASIRGALAEGLEIQDREVNSIRAGRYVEKLVNVRLDLPVTVVKPYRRKGDPQSYYLDLKSSGRADWANEGDDTGEDFE